MDTVDRLSPVTVNGIVTWLPSTYVEKDIQFKGITTPNFTILTDTSKTGGLYEIGGALDFVTNPNKIYISFNYYYINEQGYAYTKQLLTSGTQTASFQKDSNFSPGFAWVKPGSVIKIYTTQYGTTAGAVVYNCRVYIRFLGK